MNGSRREFLKPAMLAAANNSKEKSEENNASFSLQNVAEIISIEDKDEHKNGWFGSLFGGLIAGCGVSYLLIFVFLKNSNYDSFFLPLVGIVAIIAFFLIKEDISDDKKELVANSIFDDLNYLKDSFDSKFDSRYESVSFIVDNFYIIYTKEGNFTVFVYDNLNFLSNEDKSDFVVLNLMHQLRILGNITFIDTGKNISNYHSDTHMLIRGKKYHNLLFDNRKKLRNAINKLLGSSDVVYANDMTYICVSKWK